MRRCVAKEGVLAWRRGSVEWSVLARGMEVQEESADRSASARQMRGWGESVPRRLQDAPR